LIDRAMGRAIIKNGMVGLAALGPIRTKLRNGVV
jgi:hypothetical protein